MTADPTVHAIFGMGTWETLIILVVALVFLGPDKLPEVAKSIGKGLRTLRRAMSSVEYEVHAMTQPDRYEPPPQRHAPPPATDSPSGSEQHAAHHHIDPADIATDDARDPHAPPDGYDLHAAPGPNASAETPPNASAETPPNASAETPPNASAETPRPAAPVTNAAGAVAAPHPLRPMAPPAPLAVSQDAPEAQHAIGEQETEAEAS